MNLNKSVVNIFHIFINHILCVLIIIFASIVITGAQELASKAPDDCSCGTTFNNLVSKFESNYLGYHIEIRGKRDAEYLRFKESLGKRASLASPEKCIFVLQNFVKFFRDGHLFVGSYPRLTAEEINRLSNTAEKN